MLGEILVVLKMSISARCVSVIVERNLLFIAFMDENFCSHMYVNPNLQMNLRARSWSLGNCSLGTYFQNSIKFGVVGYPQSSLNLQQSPEWFLDF
jgi:hypothetical protein